MVPGGGRCGARSALCSPTTLRGSGGFCGSRFRARMTSRSLPPTALPALSVSSGRPSRAASTVSPSSALACGHSRFACRPYVEHGCCPMAGRTAGRFSRRSNRRAASVKAFTKKCVVAVGSRLGRPHSVGPMGGTGVLRGRRREERHRGARYLGGHVQPIGLAEVGKTARAGKRRWANA